MVHAIAEESYRKRPYHKKQNSEYQVQSKKKLSINRTSDYNWKILGVYSYYNFQKIKLYYYACWKWGHKGTIKVDGVEGEGTPFTKNKGGPDENVLP